MSYMSFRNYGPEVKELIGECGVDSGTLLFVDPCYVDENDDFKYQECLDALYPSKQEAHRETPAYDREQDREYAPLRGGVLAATLVGDGSYSVYRVMQGSKLLRFEIHIEDTSECGIDDDEDTDSEDEEEFHNDPHDR